MPRLSNRFTYAFAAQGLGYVPAGERADEKCEFSFCEFPDGRNFWRFSLSGSEIDCAVKKFDVFM